MKEGGPPTSESLSRLLLASLVRLLTQRSLLEYSVGQVVF
jgi:hypothetical protein